MTKTVTAFEFSDLGVNTPDCFQGAGTAFTDWDEVYQGCGDTARDAAENAAEYFYCNSEASESGEPRADIDAAIAEFDNTSSAHNDCDEQDPDCLNCIMESGPCGCHDECKKITTSHCM